MTCRLGLVALGDSITNGGGNMALGVYPRSWAHWLALALELPFTGLAEDAASAADVVARQVPRLGEAYDVGALFIGVNDVRGVDWDPASFARDHAAALQALAQRCERTLALTIPLDLGRPRAGAKVGDANAIIRSAAADHGAVVVALDDLRPWRALLPDAVHPHAVGQLEIADRAARALGAHRVPSSLGDPDSGPRARARWARAYARMWAGDVARRVREGGLRALKT
jgi:lysophospholipase L1-like esterase